MDGETRHKIKRQWRAQFRCTDASQPEFRLQQRVAVGSTERFQAVVTAVDDNHVTIRFEKDEKLGPWIEKMGPKVGCEIKTEGRTMSAIIEFAQGTTSGSAICGTVWSVDIDNRVCAKVETGRGKRCELSGKYDIQVGGGSSQWNCLVSQYRQSDLKSLGESNTIIRILRGSCVRKASEVPIGVISIVLSTR